MHRMRVGLRDIDGFGFGIGAALVFWSHGRQAL